MARSKKKNKWQEKFWAIVVWGFTGIFVLSFFANLSQTPAFQNLFVGSSFAEEDDLPQPPEEITFEGDDDSSTDDDFTVIQDDSDNWVVNDEELSGEDKAKLQDEINNLKASDIDKMLNKALTEGDPLDIPVIDNGVIDVVNVERGGDGQFGFTVDLEGDASEPVKYINLIYRFAIMISTLLAIAMLVWGGYRYVFAGVDTSAIKEGREIIGSALSGLILLLMSYIILTTLNPNIFEGGDSAFVLEGGEASLQTTPSGLVNITDYGIPVKNNALAKEATVEKLAKLWNLTEDKQGVDDSYIGLWRVTEAYPPTSDHLSAGHQDGTFVDIAFDKTKYPFNQSSYKPTAVQVDTLVNYAKQAGFSKVLDEYYGEDTEYSTGGHLHLEP